MAKKTFLVITLFALTLAYASGKRIADISETPGSKRPWSPIITAAGSSDYLSRLTQ